MQDVVDLVGRFLNGSDRSLGLVEALERLVLDRCAEENWFDDVSVALAQYAPGGGDHLLDDADLAEVLRLLKSDLERGGR